SENFGWIGIELDRAAVIAGGLFAPVQRRRRKIGAKAADRDHARAAMVALSGEAGQAGDGFTNAVVRQLADIFGIDGLDDQIGGVLLRRCAAEGSVEGRD